VQPFVIPHLELINNANVQQIMSVAHGGDYDFFESNLPLKLTTIQQQMRKTPCCNGKCHVARENPESTSFWLTQWNSPRSGPLRFYPEFLRATEGEYT